VRRICEDDEADFHGEHISFDPVRPWPKPVGASRPARVAQLPPVDALRELDGPGDLAAAVHPVVGDLTEVGA
jgi:hypothetical protein